MDDVISIRIAGRSISESDPPYVIAEVSANHNGSLDTALALISRAKAAGADAVKIQTYRADTMTLDADGEEFRIQGGLWNGRRLFDLYEEAHTPWEWHAAMFDHARSIGITLFSTPFDSTAVDLLEALGAPAYKIASFEATDLALIRKVASTGKPIIISTGLADEREIGEAISAAREGGCEQIAILHCISAYPADPGEYDLRTIPDMQRRFGLATGLSDHTIDNTTAIAAVALGACIVEKHFTLDRGGGGPDDSFSLEPDQLADLCKGLLTAWKSLGKASYQMRSGERANIKFRRSLYVSRDVLKGATVDATNVRAVRPGFGLACKHIDDVMGLTFTRDVAFATPLGWDMISGQSPVRNVTSES
jgi:N-acetylneuraminate synthase